MATLTRKTPTQPVRLFCQDESRFGLHLPCYRRLTGFGVKPEQVVLPLYEYYWMYAAVEPKTGEAFWLEMPHLNADCFEVFLAQFAQHYAESLNIMLIDGAPAHLAKRIKIPENVLLVRFPPYSPALNPVERLWQDLKRQIDVFDPAVRRTLGGLRDHVAALVRSYTEEALASLTGYPYLVEVANAL